MRAGSFIVGVGVLITAGWTIGCDPPTAPSPRDSAVLGDVRTAASSGSPQSSVGPLSVGGPAPSASSSTSSSASSSSGVPAPSASATAGAPPLLDFATLATEATKLDGKRVRVVGTTFEGAFKLDGSEGTLTVKGKTCSRVKCLPGHSCCNDCASDVSLRGKELMGVRLVDPTGGGRFGCGGDDCSMTCTPAAGRYEAVGTFRLGQGGELDLEVETLTPLP